MLLSNQTTSISLFSILKNKKQYEELNLDLDLLKSKVQDLPNRTFTNKDYTRIPVQVPISYLSKNSTNLVTLSCDFCQTHFQTTYQIFNLTKGKHACSKCVPLKRREFNQKNYGVDNPSQRQEIKDLKEKKALEVYGVKNVLSSSIVQQQVKKTNLERYGVENPQQSSAIHNKTKHTNLEKYGFENPMQSPKIIEKGRATNFIKHQSISFANGVTWRNNKYENLLLYIQGLGYSVKTSLEDLVEQELTNGFTLSLECNKCHKVFDHFCNKTLVTMK